MGFNRVSGVPREEPRGERGIFPIENHLTETAAMERGVNVLALMKNGERYVFLYDDESSSTLLQTLGRYAGSDELSFSWYDAAVLSQKVRRTRRETEPMPIIQRESQW